MPRPEKQSEHLISDIISGIATLNADSTDKCISIGGSRTPDKREELLASTQSYPEIWVNNVVEDEDEKGEDARSNDTATVSTPPPAQEQLSSSTTAATTTAIPTKAIRDEVSIKAASWLHSIERQGFPVGVLREFVRDIDTEEEDETWWEEGVVRVFQPYYDISKEEVASVEGRVRHGEPVGRCTLRLSNGDELRGCFKPGYVVNGMAVISGTNLEQHGLLNVKGFHIDGVLHGEGRAVILPGKLWSHIKCEVHLEGIFNDGKRTPIICEIVNFLIDRYIFVFPGYLEGPVRGLDGLGNLVFVGAYKRGLPFGPCWLAKEGQGWLYGEVDSKGRFSGEALAYIYPDISSCIVGSFKNEMLVEARASVVVEAFTDSNQVLNVRFQPHQPDDPAYTYCPSTPSTIPCDWLLCDCYESSTVECRISNVQSAGEGLFAIRNLPAQTIVSYYNGVKVEPSEEYSSSSYSYQIYVDWSNTDGSAFVDIPLECISSNSYRASLGHKANHSFNPNCCFISVDHPRLVEKTYVINYLLSMKLFR